MNGGLRIGRLFGIELLLHPSLLIIFLLIVANLGLGLFPSWHPDWGGALVWGMAIAAAVLFFASILLHELSHSLVAKAFGLPVTNITLFLFGGVSNIEREPPSAKIEFLIAIVGPITSLALGAIFVGLGLLTMGPVPAGIDALELAARIGPLPTLFLWLGPINLLLGVFNLLPGFPLDGGRVLRSIFWATTNNLVRATRWAAVAGRTLGWTLVAIGIMMAIGVEVPVFGTGIVGGLWLVFIGWFLSRAAAASYSQTVMNHVLGDVPVADVMTSRVRSVTAHTSVARLVDQLMEYEQRAYPVVDGDRLVGLVCLEDVRKVDKDRWANTPVSAVMTPREQLEVVRPASPAAEALRALARRGVDQVPVIEQGHFMGLVRRQDIMRWLQIHTDVPA